MPRHTVSLLLILCVLATCTKVEHFSKSEIPIKHGNDYD